MTGLTYARFFPSDWKSGTIGQLNLEEEGLYIRCCVWMWDTGTPVPADDRTAASVLHVQIQKYQKVMTSLVELGKMIRTQSGIINERVQEELDAFRGQKEVRANRARSGHENRKIAADKMAALEDTVRELKAKLEATQNQTPPHQPPTQPPHQPPLGSPGGTPPPPPTGQTEKDNKINVPKQQVQSTCSANPEARSQKPIKEEESFFLTEAAREAPKSNGRAFWSQALAPPVEPDHQAVTFEDGRLTLFNGFKAQWLEKFGGDEERLGLALLSAANYVQPYGNKSLEVQVSAQLARSVADKKDRDARAAANRPKPSKFKPSRW